MTTLSNIEEHLEEQVYPTHVNISVKIPIQPVKKRRVNNTEEEPENAKPNEINLSKTMEADKNQGFSCIGQ
jgi:hypothetical protein